MRTEVLRALPRTLLLGLRVAPLLVTAGRGGGVVALALALALAVRLRLLRWLWLLLLLVVLLSVNVARVSLPLLRAAPSARVVNSVHATATQSSLFDVWSLCSKNTSKNAQHPYPLCEAYHTSVLYL